MCRTVRLHIRKKSTCLVKIYLYLPGNGTGSFSKTRRVSPRYMWREIFF